MLTRACLDSLRRTTVPFELCVVDNASTDGTQAYFDSFPYSARLRYQRNDTNPGLIQALNQGATLATSDVLVWS